MSSRAWSQGYSRSRSRSRSPPPYRPGGSKRFKPSSRSRSPPDAHAAARHPPPPHRYNHSRHSPDRGNSRRPVERGYPPLPPDRGGAPSGPDRWGHYSGGDSSYHSRAPPPPSSGRDRPGGAQYLSSHDKPRNGGRDWDQRGGEPGWNRGGSGPPGGNRLRDQRGPTSDRHLDRSGGSYMRDQGRDSGRYRDSRGGDPRDYRGDRRENYEYRSGGSREYERRPYKDDRGPGPARGPTHYGRERRGGGVWGDLGGGSDLGEVILIAPGVAPPKLPHHLRSQALMQHKVLQSLYASEDVSAPHREYKPPSRDHAPPKRRSEEFQGAVTLSASEADLCFDFSKGSCSRGDKCFFSHDVSKVNNKGSNGVKGDGENAGDTRSRSPTPPLDLSSISRSPTPEITGLFNMDTIPKANNEEEGVKDSATGDCLPMETNENDNETVEAVDATDLSPISRSPTPEITGFNMNTIPKANNEEEGVKDSATAECLPMETNENDYATLEAVDATESLAVEPTETAEDKPTEAIANCDFDLNEADEHKEEPLHVNDKDDSSDSENSEGRCR